MVQPDTGRIVVHAGPVGAVTMPGELGRRVRDDMLRRRIDLGPILSHIGSGRWTFLCRPGVGDGLNDMRLFAALFRLNVSIVAAGAAIALPSPTAESMRHRRWIVAPCDSFRPAEEAILDAVAACTGGWSWTR
ncbi:DNA-directed RNA polymerase subunit beta [Nocardia aobensis]|uniref:DNA-directed RNA polymerase subunit beta n=1 Tax=Nocardia aobensis TaxID=257277 RepID=A0ABW6PC67_9NOCA